MDLIEAGYDYAQPLKTPIPQQSPSLAAWQSQEFHLP